MNSFLYRIASTFFHHHNTSVSNFTFVFPNRRAGLFFQRYLSQISNKPIFSPEIITINDCFASASNLQIADRLSMLFRLYRIYIENIKTDESFDSFVFWGEMLLSDFNDIDKYRVDARQLFTNVTELKQLDKLFNIFTEKQIEAIRNFWTNFVPVVEGKTQEEFVATWKILFSVYEQFRKELIAENIATEGMICREVADRLETKNEIDKWEQNQFVFIGFNALNPCERTLLVELQKRGKADFYWDYEAEELRDPENPASMFYAENTHLFPSKYQLIPVIESLLDKEIEIISTPSAVGQAKQTYSILNNIYPTFDTNENWMNTAIVLPDESQLVPLLHSLPLQIKNINITMGFPLKITPIAGLIEHIFELQHRIRISGNNASFYHQSILNILNHQYIALICKSEIKRIINKMTTNNLIYVDSIELQFNELLSTIFIPQTNAAGFLDYLLHLLRCLQKHWHLLSSKHQNYQIESDFIYQYHISINRMADIVKKNNGLIEMNLDTLMRLIRQLTAGITIAFEGEPLNGLQVMGVLETRGLDFENLIITSFNEGIFPKKSVSNSFIPNNLRKGFNLPTYEYQDAITSYNFYRLIHHAKKIYFLFDSRTDSSQTGEISRYFHQLYYHYGVECKQKTVSFDISFDKQNKIQVDKTPEVMIKLQAFLMDNEFSKSLSASSIKTYIDCPLQFYFTQIENVEQTEEVTETIEESMFGTIFHAVMEYVYEPFKGQTLQAADIEKLTENQLYIDKLINKAFAIKFFKKDKNATITLEGNNLLVASVIRKYIIQVLKNDKQYTPFKYINSEERCKIRYKINGGLINLKGFIDRIDEKDGLLRILDYKTGGGKLEFKNWDEVFEHNNENRPKHVLQTFLYGLFYKNKAEGKTIMPGIYYMRNVFKEGFVTAFQYKPDKNTSITVDNYEEYEEEFNSRLTSCLEEIFDPAVPFFQSTSTEPCKYCAYISVCNR